MSTRIHNQSISPIKKLTSIFVLVAFLLNIFVYSSGAQVLPGPGTSVGLTPGFRPPVLLGLKIHPENPLLFDFIVDQGQSQLSPEEIQTETEKLVKYFLAALTIPDKEVWVNLSPNEKDRIIPDVLGQTIMGQTMLEQDYLLKQLASSLTNPETELGKKYWDSAPHSTAKSNFMNKVWIVPEKAEILESQNIVLVGEKKLKVMMAEEYEKNTAQTNTSFREMILPHIEKEVNEGKNFADVRQIYNSVILAAWYKKTLKESLLGRVYADQAKVAGVQTDDKKMKERIYEQYLAAFKKGAYNLIKEESDRVTGEMVPRKYFSGGAVFDVGETIHRTPVSNAVVSNAISASSSINVQVRLAEESEKDKVSSSSAFELPQALRAKKALDVSKLKEIQVTEKGTKGTYRVFVDPAQPGVEYHVGHEDRYMWDMLENEIRMYGVFYRYFADFSFAVVPEVLEYGNVQRPAGQSIFNRSTAPYIKFKVPVGSERLGDQSEIWRGMNLNEQLSVLIRLAEMYASMHDEQILHGNVFMNNILIASDEYGNPKLRITNFTNAQSVTTAKVDPRLQQKIGNPVQVEIQNFENMIRYALEEKVKREVDALPEFTQAVGLQPIIDDARLATRTGDRYSTMWEVVHDLQNIKEKLEQLQERGIVPKNRSRKDTVQEFRATMERLMGKPLRVVQVGSTAVTESQRQDFIFYHSGILLSLFLNENTGLGWQQLNDEQRGMVYRLFSGTYRNLSYRIIQKTKLDSEQGKDLDTIIWETIKVMSEVGEAWTGSIALNVANKDFDNKKWEEGFEFLRNMGLTGDKPMNERLRLSLFFSLKHTVPEFGKMLPTRASSQLSQGEDDEKSAQAQLLLGTVDATAEAVREANGKDFGLDLVPQSQKALDQMEELFAGVRLLRDLGQEKAPDDVEYVNEDTLEAVLEQIWSIHILQNVDNQSAVYFNATKELSYLTEPRQLAAAERILVALGFERDRDEEIVRGPMTKLYGLRVKDKNGAESWANYTQLEEYFLTNYGYRIRPRSVSSAVLDELARKAVGDILAGFDTTAQQEMQPYVDLMGRMGQRVVKLSQNDIAKEFVRALILKMVELGKTNVEDLDLQQWHEIADVMLRSPEQIDPPGDFINQLTVLPADGNLKALMTERQFHEKFVQLMAKAVGEIIQFKIAFDRNKSAIFGILNSEDPQRWYAIATLRDFLARGEAVPMDSGYFLILLQHQLVNADGTIPDTVRAAMRSFAIPSSESISQGDRKFRFDAASSSIEELTAELNQLKNTYQLSLAPRLRGDSRNSSVQVWKNPLTNIAYTLVVIFEDSGRQQPAVQGILDGDFGAIPTENLAKILQISKMQTSARLLGMKEIAGLTPPKTLESEFFVDDAALATAITVQSGSVQNIPVTVVEDKDKGISVVVPVSVKSEAHAQLILNNARYRLVTLVSDSVFIKYLGMIKVRDKWYELTQLIKFNKSPKDPIQIAYLEGNVAQHRFESWTQIDHLKLDEVSVEALRETVHVFNIEDFQERFRRLSSMDRQEIITQFRIAVPKMETPAARMPRDSNKKYKSLLVALGKFGLPAALFYEIVPNESLAAAAELRREEFAQLEALWTELNVENQLSAEEQQVIDKLRAEKDLAQYLAALPQPELFELAKIILKAPHHEEYVTLSQWNAFKSGSDMSARDLQLIIWKYINNFRNGTNEEDQVHLADIAQLDKQLRKIISSIFTDPVAAVVAGPRKGDLEQMEVVLREILSPTSADQVGADVDSWVREVQKDIYNLEYEISQIKIVASKKAEVANGSLTAAELADMVTIWLRDLTRDEDYKSVSPTLIVGQMVELVNELAQTDPQGKVRIVAQVVENAESSIIDPKAIAYKSFIAGVAPERASSAIDDASLQEFFKLKPLGETARKMLSTIPGAEAVHQLIERLFVDAGQVDPTSNVEYGRVYIFYDRAKNPYTVFLAQPLEYRSFAGKAAILEGDFSGVHINDLVKIANQQAPFVDPDKLVWESYGYVRQAIPGKEVKITTGNLSLPQKPDFSATLIEFANARPILVPGKIIDHTSKFESYEKISTIEKHAKPSVLELAGKSDVLFIQYRGLIDIQGQLVDATQFVRIKDRRLVEVKYAEGYWDGSLIKNVQIYNNLPSIKASSATLAQDIPLQSIGGIDFDTSSLNLQIKRDGQGVPLPLTQQNFQEIHINGLYPIIINITPLNPQTLPLFIDAQGAL